MSVRRPGLVLLAVLLLIGVASAAAGQPDLQRVTPPGGQRGATVDIVLSGERLADADALLLYQPGLTVLALEADSEQQVRVRLQIAPTAQPGEHRLRLRTRTGISAVRTFWVGPYPDVTEVEPNNEFARPQVITPGATVTGTLPAEDVDCYAVDVTAGTRISVEIEALRLGRTMFDPAVAILDARRFELAQNDDSTLLLQDSVASVVAAEDGRYVIRVREASYGGCDGCVYRLHVGSHPRPTRVVPPGARVGAAVTVALHGDPAGVLTQEVTAPTEPGLHPIQPEDEHGSSPAPVWWRVADMPIFDETDMPAEAPPVPVAYHGTIAAEGEVDLLPWQMQNGRAYVVNVFARRLRTPLDPLVQISRRGGENSVSNDDAVGLDPRIQFTAAADGIGEVRLSDRLRRGGQAFSYRAEITAAPAALRIGLPLLNSRAVQYRQTLPVAAGNRNAQLVRVERENVGGPVQLTLENLPPGLEAVLPPIPADTDRGPLLIRATSDAAPAGALAPLEGVIEQNGVSVRGRLRQDVPLVVAPPNETVYYRTTVEGLAVAACEPAPFRLEVTPPGVPLVRGGAMRLAVRLERAEGFDGKVECRMLWNPPGVVSAGTVTINEGQTEVAYPIQAQGNAPLATRPLCIIARGGTGRGEVWVSSELIPVTIAEPYVTGSIQMAAVEQGGQVDLTVTLQQLRPFEGTGTLRLVNLPAGTSTESVQIDATMSQAVFRVTATAEAPPTTSRNLFCQLVIEQNGEPITHLFGQGGTLRIDKPRPVEVAAAAPAPASAAAPAPAEQKAPAAPPRSRLEQLRQEAKARREQQR